MELTILESAGLSSEERTGLRRLTITNDEIQRDPTLACVRPYRAIRVWTGKHSGWPSKLLASGECTLPDVGTCGAFIGDEWKSE
jgi:hypothetical protein